MIDVKGCAVRAATFALAATGDQIAKLYQATRDPWPVYEKIRERGPVYRSRLGYAAVTSHELCAKVLRDPVFGIRDSKGALPPDQELPIGTEPSLLELDPPDHGRLRKLVAPAFRALSERLPRIRPAGVPQQRPSASIRGFLELPLAA